MTDAYVNNIRQVTTLLGYQELQILDIFKNTLPTKLYWVLFPIMDLRQVVETAKRVLTKEKIDGQLAGQNSLTPFMNMRDNCNKRVTFNMTDNIEQKLDKLTAMMGKLVTEDEGQSKNFKPLVYQSNRGRGQNRGRFRSNNAYRGSSRYNQDFRGRMRYSLNNIGSYGYNMRCNQRYRRNNNNRRGNYRNWSYDRNDKNKSRSYEMQSRNRRNQ